MTAHFQSISSNHPSGGSTETPALPCKSSCCKTPYGHSTVRDQIPSWHKDACHCHEAVKVDPMRAIFAEAAALRETGTPE